MSGPTITATQTSSWPTLLSGRLTVVPQIWNCFFKFDLAALTFSDGFVPDTDGSILITTTNTVTGKVSEKISAYTGLTASSPIVIDVDFATVEGLDSYNSTGLAANPVEKLHTCTFQFFNNTTVTWGPAYTSADFNFTPCQSVVWGNALFQDAGNGSVSVTWPDATYNGLALATDNGHIGNLTSTTDWPMNAPAQMSPNVATIFVYMPGAVKVYNNGGTIPAWTTYELLPLVCGVPQTAELYLANVATMSATAALEGSTPVSIPFDTTPGTSLTKARIKKPGDTAYSWVPIVIDNGFFTATNTLTGNEVFVVQSGTEKVLYYDNYPDVFAGQYIEFGSQNVISAIYGITNKFSLTNFEITNFENLNTSTYFSYHGQAKTKILINGVEKTPTIVKITSSNYLPQIASALAQNPSDDIIIVLTSDRFTSYNSDTGLITWQERSGTVVRNYLSQEGYVGWYFSSNQFLLNEYTVKFYNDEKPDTVLYSYIRDNGETIVIAIDRTMGEIHTFTSQHIQSYNLNSPAAIDILKYFDFSYCMFYQNTTGSSLYLLDLSSSLNTSLVIQSSTTDLLAISLEQINTLTENTFYVGHVEPTWTSVHVPTSLELTGSFPSAAIVWQDAGTWNTNLASTEVQAGSTGIVTPTVNTLCYNVSGAPLQYTYTPGPTSSVTASSGTLAADTALYVDAGATVDFTTDGPTSSTTYTVYLLDGTTTLLTVETEPIVGTVVTTGDYSGVYNTISATSSSLSNSMQGDFFMNTSGGPMYLYSNMLVSALITVPDGSLLYVGVDEAITLMVTEYIFSTIPLSAVTTVGPSAPSNVYVWSTGTGSSTSWHSAVSGTTSLVDDLRSVDQSSTSTVGYYSIDASSRPYVAYNSTNASIKYMWPTQGSAEYTLQASRAVYISASTANFYVVSEQMASLPASVIAQLAALPGAPTVTAVSKPAVALPTTANGNSLAAYGSIVKEYLEASRPTDATAGAEYDALKSPAGRMVVKFHMDYTRVLEAALAAKVNTAVNSAFKYVEAIGLGTAAAPSVEGNPHTLSFAVSSATVEKGSYFKTTGGFFDRRYALSITGTGLSSAQSVTVTSGDALVWNGASFDILASIDSAVVVGGDSGQPADPYLNITSDASSGTYTIHFNGEKVADKIATAKSEAITDANSYTDTAVSGAASDAANALSGAVETLSGDISGAVSGAAEALSGAVDTLSGAISGAASDAANALSGAVDTLSGAISGAASDAANALSGAQQTLLIDIASEANRAIASETYLANSLEANMRAAATRLTLLESFMAVSEQYMDLTDSSGVALNFTAAINAYPSVASGAIATSLTASTTLPITIASGTVPTQSAVTQVGTFTAGSSVNILQ